MSDKTQQRQEERAKALRENLRKRKEKLKEQKAAAKKDTSK